MACSRPTLQDILEKCVRELGAIRLIDSRIGVPGQLARNPPEPKGNLRAILDNKRYSMASFSHCLRSISGFTPYIQTSIEPVDRLVVAFVGLMTSTLLA